MNRRHLPGNFVDNPEALFRKTRAKLKKKSSTLQHEASSNQEDRRSFIRNLSSEFEVMANKSIREFSAPTMDNIRTGPAVEIDCNFELKPGLINMVQSNQFCGKAHEVLISNTSWRFAAHSPYQESSEMLYYFACSHSHCWGERSSGSTLQKRRILRRHSTRRTFWLSSFPWARPMLSVGKIIVFSNNMMNPFQKHGSASKTTS